MKDRIKQIRKEKNLTQQDFVKILGVSRSNLAGYETGSRVPSDAVISLICSKFGVNERWLRTGEGKMFLESDSFSLDEYVRSHNGTQIELDILKAYFEIDLETRQKVIEGFRRYFAKKEAEEFEKQHPAVEDEEQTG